MHVLMIVMETSIGIYGESQGCKVMSQGCIDDIVYVGYVGLMKDKLTFYTKVLLAGYLLLQRVSLLVP